MQDVKAAVQKQFGDAAVNYRNSAVHASGEDLRQLVGAARLTGSEVVMDAGCGAGHTALAVAAGARRVIAYDLTASMLEQVEALAAERGIQNVETRQGDVEHLPFEDATFDLVVSRYSAHHWPHPEAALHEFARVLKPGGRFILSDIMAADDPTLDTFLQTIELVRDPSHVRDHSTAQWIKMMGQSQFAAEVIFTWELPLDFIPWVERIGTSEIHVQALKSLFDGAPSEVRKAMDIQPNYRFTIPGGLIEARKL